MYDLNGVDDRYYGSTRVFVSIDLTINNNEVTDEQRDILKDICNQSLKRSKSILENNMTSEELNLLNFELDLQGDGTDAYPYFNYGIVLHYKFKQKEKCQNVNKLTYEDEKIIRDFTKKIDKISDIVVDKLDKAFGEYTEGKDSFIEFCAAKWQEAPIHFYYYM